MILRLGGADADPQRVRLETVVQNTLAGMGYPAPQVMMTESNPDILGGPFMKGRAERLLLTHLRHRVLASWLLQSLTDLVLQVICFMIAAKLA